MTDQPDYDAFSPARTDDPYWNESVWFSLACPEARLNGIIHYYFRPNMGLLNGGPILWQPDRTSIWNCLFFDWAHLQAAPPGMAKFDMRAANSLTCRVLEPLTRYAIGYDNHGCRIDLTWAAIGPLHDMRSGHSVQEQNARLHFEQAGRMTGTIELDGRTIAIDCMSLRDGSSGPRTYDRIASGSYFWGVAADSCFHAMAMGEGRVRSLIGGYIWKDGAMGSIVSGTRTALDYGTYGPSRVRVEGVDTLGRDFLLEGRVEPGLIHTGYTTHTVVWSLTEWTWDGATHWGEHQEFQSARKFRQIARGELALGDARASA